MGLTKRKGFLLLVGACGVILILLAIVLDYKTSQRVFLVAANFHNTSWSYLTALNLNVSILSKEKPGEHLWTKEEIKYSKIPGTTLKSKDVSVMDVYLRDVKKQDYSKLRNKLLSDVIDATGGSSVRNKTPSDVVKDVRPEFGTRESNRYHSSSDFNKQSNQNTVITSKKHSSDLSIPRKDSRANSVKRSNKKESVVNNTYYGDPSIFQHNSELYRGGTANSENQTEKHTTFPNIFQISDHRKQHDSPIISVASTRGVSSKADTVEQVNPEHILEEVEFQEIDNTIGEVRDPIENAAGELKYTNHDSIEDIKHKLESSLLIDRVKEFQGAKPERDGQIKSEFENKARVTDIPNRGQGRVIHAEIGPGPVGSELGNRVQKTVQQDRTLINEKKEIRYVSTRNQTGNSQIYQEMGASLTDDFPLDPKCRSRITDLEDILCMNPPKLLPDFRNPCWYHDGSLRCLPYFHIIGVCKTGTTDLFERLSRHPLIIKNNGILGKETWYWTWKRYGHVSFHKRLVPRMTLDDFINKFDAHRIEHYTKRRPNGTIYHPAVTGHGDPMDFWDQASWKLIPQNDPTAEIPEVTTPSLIKHINPNVKLILLLRDPVERLFSNYLHGQFGFSATMFHDDVMTSVSLLTSCTKTRSMKSCLYDEDILQSLKVPISGSFYSVHLQEWLNVFPRKQIYITRTEDFSKNVADTLLGIFRFLRLDPLPTRTLYGIANMPHFYGTKAKQFAGEILDETRTVLRDLFQPYNIELASMLNDERFNFNNI